MIIDVSDATFESEVLVRSQTVPVVLDFWASWCGPCKTLTPILEKVIAETDGAVILAKVNTEENEQIPAAFKVQSIPAVYALYGGQMVDNFVGAKPEAEVRQFVGKLLALGAPGIIDGLLEAGDEASLRKALEMEPNNKPAVLALSQLLVDRGAGIEAVKVLGAIEADNDTAPLAAAARELALPADSLRRIETKLGELLPKVKVDEQARKEFISNLETVAAASPDDAARWRKKLSTAIY